MLCNKKNLDHKRVGLKLFYLNDLTHTGINYISFKLFEKCYATKKNLDHKRVGLKLFYLKVFTFKLDRYEI